MPHTGTVQRGIRLNWGTAVQSSFARTVAFAPDPSLIILHRFVASMSHRVVERMFSAMADQAAVRSRSWSVLVAALAVTAASPAHGHQDNVVANAIADSRRPASDRDRDVNRKPLEVLVFAGVRVGDRVADYAAGQGYFTRLFSGIVGNRGHVYASVPAPLFKFPNIIKGTADLAAYVKDHQNVSLVVAAPLAAARYPEKLDLFWIAQNYHDLKDSFMGPVDMAEFNKAVWRALKPGGTYIVLDHVARTNSPGDVTDTLHRIDPDVVRREVERAGFRFVGQSKVLANPADAHNKEVFDASIRGRTDQFIFKFRKD